MLCSCCRTWKKNKTKTIVDTFKVRMWYFNEPQLICLIIYFSEPYKYGILQTVVACYFMSRESAALRLIFYDGNRNDMLSVASNVSIASDDDQIQAHKWKWGTVLHTMKAFWFRFGQLIQKQAFWYRFRHLIQVQAFCFVGE